LIDLLFRLFLPPSFFFVFCRRKRQKPKALFELLCFKEVKEGKREAERLKEGGGV
tara:strand:- start:369 stop:533 length:165 start_codon:yes stop_codon:yes gene_type:complete